MEYFALFLLINSCVAQLNISQPVPFQAVQLGHDVTLECYTYDSVHIVWYKLTALKGLHCVIRIYFGEIFYCDSDRYNDSRVSLELDKDRCHLNIRNAGPEDTGTYFCGVVHSEMTEFGSGTFLMIHGVELGNKNSVVQLPVSESAQPGDAVTLTCTVYTQNCGGQHCSVYWFRSSGESQPLLIDTQGSMPEACQKTPRTGQYSCVYKLTVRNVTVADAGHYVCAVTLCGEMFFGNGSRLDVGDIKEADYRNQVEILVLLSISRTGVLLVCLLILTVVYVIRK